MSAYPLIMIPPNTTHRYHLVRLLVVAGMIAAAFTGLAQQAPTPGMERRQDRRDDRTERIQQRDDKRQERREDPLGVRGPQRREDRRDLRTDRRTDRRERIY